MLIDELDLYEIRNYVGSRFRIKFIRVYINQRRLFEGFNPDSLYNILAAYANK